MADEDKTTVEVKDGDEQDAPKKGGSKLILFGGIGLVVVIIGVVLALFVLKPMMAGDSASGDTEQTTAGDGHSADGEDVYDDEDDPEEDGGGGGHGGGGEEADNGMIAAIKEIVVNPAGTSGSRYLSVSLGFAFGSKKARKRFEENELMVRDALISILSSKTVTQLTDAKQKEIMRYQIKKRLSKLLKTKKLEAVYYTDFVLQ